MTAAQERAQAIKVARRVRLDVDDTPRIDATAHSFVARLDYRVAADDGKWQRVLQTRIYIVC